MRKNHLLILSIVLILTVSLILVACGNKGDSKEHEYDFGEWKVITNPTNSTKGLAVRECKTCHKAKTYVLPAINDTDYKSNITKEPTCIAIGKIEYSYNIDKDIVIFTNDIPIIDHRQKNNNANYCEMCGKVIDDSVFDYVLLEDNTYSVEKYTGSYANILIPATYKSKPVTRISLDAFQECNTLQGITIPSGITYIEQGAFYACNSLKSITISSSVSHIEDAAFYGCSAIENIVVDRSNSNYTSTDSKGNECSSLIDKKTNTLMLGCKNTVIPNNIKHIGNGAFYGCSTLDKIVIPDSVNSIGDYAFVECTALTSINLPDSMRSIGKVAFAGCASLTSINIPNNVTSMGESVFNGCNSLKIHIEATSEPYGWGPNWNINGSNDYISVVWGYNNITTDANYDYVVHHNKVYLTKYKGTATDVNIPNKIADMDVVGLGATFSGNENIISITIPNSVTSIYEYAFAGCSSLASIKIPNSVTSIEEGIFISCKSLTNIVVDSTNKQYTSRNNAGNESNCIVDKATSTLIAGCINTIIPDGVVRIGNEVFYNSLITSISIPNSVTNIGDRAFSHCSSLKNIELPDGLITIGDQAFSDCHLFTNLEIPRSVTTIGNYAFAVCMRLENVIIPISVVSMGDGAFSCKMYAEATSRPSGWASSWTQYSMECWYSETRPTIEPPPRSEYWHYAADGKTPVIW